MGWGGVEEKRGASSLMSSGMSEHIHTTEPCLSISVFKQEPKLGPQRSIRGSRSPGEKGLGMGRGRAASKFPSAWGGVREEGERIRGPGVIQEGAPGFGVWRGSWRVARQFWQRGRGRQAEVGGVGSPRLGLPEGAASPARVGSMGCN